MPLWAVPFFALGLPLAACVGAYLVRAGVTAVKKGGCLLCGAALRVCLMDWLRLGAPTW